MSDAVTAPQSKTTSGPVARRLCSWTARVSTSLPLPVSPVRRTVTSLAASFSSIAKTAPIAGLTDTALPKRRTSSTGASVSTNRRVAPSTATTPGWRITSRIAAPPTKVPFVEPRSRRTTPTGVGSSSQCRRDTCGSITIRSTSVPLPMRSRRRLSGSRSTVPSGATTLTQRAGAAGSIRSICCVVSRRLGRERPVCLRIPVGGHRIPEGRATMANGVSHRGGQLTRIVRETNLAQARCGWHAC